jgi:uncharacterized protein
MNPAVRMRWDDLLFLHWPVDPQHLRALIPPQVELDLFDAKAWIALVPFRMEATRFRGVPALPGLGAFYECNVRTYVSVKNAVGNPVPGVWFFSLDAEHLLPVLGGRWLWSLNYIHSNFTVSKDIKTDIKTDSAHQPSGSIDYAMRRRRDATHRTHIRWTPGASLPPSEPGSIEHFLTERYWLYTLRRGRIMGGRVAHPQWSLREAHIDHLDDTLIASAGLEVLGQPLAWHSNTLEVQGWNLVSMDQVH